MFAGRNHQIHSDIRNVRVPFRCRPHCGHIRQSAYGPYACCYTVFAKCHWPNSPQLTRPNSATKRSSVKRAPVCIRELHIYANRRIQCWPADAGAFLSAASACCPIAPCCCATRENYMHPHRHHLPPSQHIRATCSRCIVCIVFEHVASSFVVRPSRGWFGDSTYEVFYNRISPCATIRRGQSRDRALQ